MKKKILIILLIILTALCIPMITKAADITRNIYSNNGSMKFSFTGLELNKEHEYEFGLTKTAATQVEQWHDITEYTTSSATVDVMTTTTDLRDVINAVDTGYIRIRDKSDPNKIVLEATAVDLKIPFLNLTNYTVIPNGKEFDSNQSQGIQIALRCASNSTAYYQYEKITDTEIINKYKELKANKGDYLELQSLLKQTTPTSNWIKWNYWNGYNYATGMNGYGYTQESISVPDSGLYYMWVYFSGNNLKNVYGYILVDNLQPDIALDGISLPKTQTVELGTTLKLSPTFNPSNATNKIVTWSSSDESVATVDNAGKITPKKLGSTIITVTSQDGKKKATCTVTVTSKTSSSGSSSTGTGSTGTSGTSSQKDPTTASGKMPQTGIYSGIIITTIALAGIGIFTFKKYRNLRDI